MIHTLHCTGTIASDNFRYFSLAIATFSSILAISFLKSRIRCSELTPITVCVFNSMFTCLSSADFKRFKVLYC